jgi:hypothetical protein
MWNPRGDKPDDNIDDEGKPLTPAWMTSILQLKRTTLKELDLHGNAFGSDDFDKSPGRSRDFLDVLPKLDQIESFTFKGAVTDTVRLSSNSLGAY